MKNKSGYEVEKVGKETKHEEKRGRDRSEEVFVKLSKIKKALPLALVLAMVFSIAVIAVSGGLLPTPWITPKIQCSVSPLEGNWDDTFTYNLSVIGPREAKFTLEIYQPANNTWEIKDKENQTWTYTPPKAPNETSFTIKPFIEQSQGGISSYRFKYEDGILNTTLGPYPGPHLIPPEPNVSFYPTNLTAYLGSEPSDIRESNEADYNMYSGDTTPFDYVVNASASQTKWYDISLLVYDPVKGEWEDKGSKKLFLEAGKNKTLKWAKIKPFESLDESKIDDYIGKQANFTFVYDGTKVDRDFSGPELVVAFKNPKCDPPVVPYEGYFNYSIDVIGSRTLSITLEYLYGREWISENITNATWNNYTDVGNWTNHTWECQAINTWEDVRFKWWDSKSETKSAEKRSYELGVSQLSASKPKRSYPVPVIVKDKEEK